MTQKTMSKLCKVDPGKHANWTPKPQIKIMWNHKLQIYTRGNLNQYWKDAQIDLPY